MIALATPVLALDLGFPDDGTKPESRTERRAYDLIADGFGPGANGPLVIAVDISQGGSVVAPIAAVLIGAGFAALWEARPVWAKALAVAGAVVLAGVVADKADVLQKRAHDGAWMLGPDHVLITRRLIADLDNAVDWLRPRILTLAGG